MTRYLSVVTLLFLGLVEVLCLLLLPGVAGRAYAQGGRLTPQQEAWLRQVYMGRTSMYDQAYINGVSWTNWAQVHSGQVDWVTLDWSNSVARQITSGDTSRWNEATHPRTGIWGMDANGQLKLASIFSESAAGFWKMDSSYQIVVSTNWWTDAWWTTNAQGQIVTRSLP